MNLAKKIILLTSLLVGQTAHASNSYLINFGDDLWSVELLIETCPHKLIRAVNMIASSLSSDNQEIVAILPATLGYQYFRVEFKEFKNGEILNLETPIVYQFEYWTQYDEHERCIEVEPHSITN